VNRTGFDAAIAIGRTSPDVEVTTPCGAPALKVRGDVHLRGDQGRLSVRARPAVARLA
jgi:hypothetical protein